MENMMISLLFITKKQIRSVPRFTMYIEIKKLLYSIINFKFKLVFFIRIWKWAYETSWWDIHFQKFPQYVRHRNGHNSERIKNINIYSYKSELFGRLQQVIRVILCLIIIIINILQLKNIKLTPQQCHV